ncbi:hypothetical protein F4809DRAFT_640982 [Biscogniauxia mediterranea]|nr:hypothetical protein F4809DRAFT_640982 [Biscogniauxia mediterranea]
MRAGKPLKLALLGSGIQGRTMLIGQAVDAVRQCKKPSQPSGLVLVAARRRRRHSGSSRKQDPISLQSTPASDVSGTRGTAHMHPAVNSDACCRALKSSKSFVS